MPQGQPRFKLTAVRDLSIRCGVDATEIRYGLDACAFGYSATITRGSRHGSVAANQTRKPQRQRNRETIPSERLHTRTVRALDFRRLAGKCF